MENNQVIFAAKNTKSTVSKGHIILTTYKQNYKVQ